MGLPSGTMWSSADVGGELSNDEARARYGKNMPSAEEWEELVHNCRKSINGNMLTLKSKTNGNELAFNLIEASKSVRYWTADLCPDIKAYAMRLSGKYGSSVESYGRFMPGRSRVVKRII